MEGSVHNLLRQIYHMCETSVWLRMWTRGRRPLVRGCYFTQELRIALGVQSLATIG